jgi:hypothetical protein
MTLLRDEEIAGGIGVTLPFVVVDSREACRHSSTSFGKRHEITLSLRNGHAHKKRRSVRQVCALLRSRRGYCNAIRRRARVRRLKEGSSLRGPCSHARGLTRMRI